MSSETPGHPDHDQGDEPTHRESLADEFRELDGPDPLDPAPTTPSTATSPLGVVDSLTIRSEAAAAVGSALLASGMASYRVKVAMARTARALGLDSFVSIVTFSDITATATLRGRYRTRVTQPSHVGVNVDHMFHTQRLVETLPSHVTAQEVFERLDEIQHRPALYPALVSALAAGLACGAFAFLNQGGPVEMLGALVGAFGGQLMRRKLQARSWNHFPVTVIAAIVASTLYLLLVDVPTELGWLPGSHQAGYLAAVLFLVPGFPLITGFLDLVRSDWSAGIARITYSAVMIAGAAAAIWSVGLAFGAAHGDVLTLDMPVALELPLRALATFVGVVGFAVVFNSPWRIALTAGAVSLVANSLRFALTEGDIPVQLATLFATALVGVIAYVIARTRHLPRTSISVPAVVIMIPGFAMYASYALLTRGDVAGAAMETLEAVQVVAAAALGLALAHLATSPQWRRVEQPH
jgi:uncharacterized membrane protein YjjP (DUF1212 family)